MKQDEKSAHPKEQALSKQIKVELIERDMTQTELAERIGVGRVVMNRYLNGRSSFGFAQLLSIADVFEMDLSELIRRSEARLPEQDQTL